MTVLLDECVPRKLKALLAGHLCTTVPEAELSGKKNGELLKLERFTVTVPDSINEVPLPYGSGATLL